MGDTFAEIVATGPLPLGIAVAVVAGLVSFFSPCILPLVPGYLAYVTGLSGADLAAARGAPPDNPAPTPGEGGVATATRTAPARGRVLAGVLLFIAGFGAVFITLAVVAAGAGATLREHQRVLELGGGLLIIGFGLALLGLVPGLTREVRVHRLPAAGLVGAPVFGAVFGLSWIPCIGPTIGAVLALGAVGGETGRAVTLAAAYTLGLGLPFLGFGWGLRHLMGLVGAIRRHSAWVTRAGAALLIAVGLALLTGGWGEFVSWLRINVGAGTVGL